MCSLIILFNIILYNQETFFVFLHFISLINNLVSDFLIQESWHTANSQTIYLCVCVSHHCSQDTCRVRLWICLPGWTWFQSRVVIGGREAAEAAEAEAAEAASLLPSVLCVCVCVSHCQPSMTRHKKQSSLGSWMKRPCFVPTLRRPRLFVKLGGFSLYSLPSGCSGRAFRLASGQLRNILTARMCFQKATWCHLLSLQQLLSGVGSSHLASRSHRRQVVPVRRRNQGRKRWIKGCRWWGRRCVDVKSCLFVSELRVFWWTGVRSCDLERCSDPAMEKTKKEAQFVSYFPLSSPQLLWLLPGVQNDLKNNWSVFEWLLSISK